MDSNMPFAVRLEVTVPRILLPELQPSAGQVDTSTVAQERASEQTEEKDRQEDSIRLIFHRPALSLEQHPVIEASSRAAHSLYFRLLQAVMPVTGHVFGLQILRGRNRVTNKRNRIPDTGNDEALYVSDEIAISLEFRRSQSDPHEPTLPTSSLTPGLNQAVIYVDDEDTPVSYSIDGAES